MFIRKRRKQIPFITYYTLTQLSNDAPYKTKHCYKTLVYRFTLFAVFAVMQYNWYNSLSKVIVTEKVVNAWICRDGLRKQNRKEAACKLMASQKVSVFFQSKY